MKKQVLFIQGGGEGAHQEDKILAENLRDVLGTAFDVRYPKMPDEASPDSGAWKVTIARELAALDGDVVLVGHSVGAFVLLKYFPKGFQCSSITAVMMSGCRTRTSRFTQKNYRRRPFTSSTAGDISSMVIYPKLPATSKSSKGSMVKVT